MHYVYCNSFCVRRSRACFSTRKNYTVMSISIRGIILDFVVFYEINLFLRNSTKTPFSMLFCIGENDFFRYLRRVYSRFVSIHSV